MNDREAMAANIRYVEGQLLVCRFAVYAFCTNVRQLELFPE